MELTESGTDTSLPRGEGMGRARNITRGLGSLAIQNIITSTLSFVFLATLVRFVPYADYNAYSSVLVSVGIVASISIFGLQSAATRFLAFYQDDETKRWQAARSIFFLSLTFSLVAAVIFDVIAQQLSIYFTKGTAFTYLFQIGGLWTFAFSLSATLQGFVQGIKRYTLLAKMLVVSRVSMVIFTVVALEFTRSIDFAIFAWTLYYGITILWTLKIIWRNLFVKSDSSYYSTIMRYAYPLGLSAVFGVLATNGDSVILGGYTQSLGVYIVVITISTILKLLIVTPLITTLLPEASSSAGTEAQISNGTRLAIRLLFLALLPISLLVASVSRQLLSLFSGGGSYLLGVEPLEIIAITFIFLGIQAVGISILGALGMTHKVLIVGVVTLVVDIGLSLLLVPNYGIYGATASKVTVVILSMILCMYYIRAYLDKLDSYKFYAKTVLAALVPFAVIFELSLQISSRILTLVPYAVIWIVIFLFCTRALKVFTDEDRTFISHLTPAPLRRFIKYL